MTEPLERLALLLMDFMPSVVPAHGGDERLLRRVAETSEVVRQRSIDVVHVRVQFPQGSAEVSPFNRVFATAAASLAGSDVTGVHPALRMTDDDFVVTKKRISAFSGSDLDLLLRARRTTTVVLAGVATSGVVLSTLRQAADLDYRIVVLADGCADRDDDLHDVLMRKVFPSQADVTSTSEWLSTI
jgi:nicotinamidase-related amidase